jgi:hypothetical protein
VNGRTRVEVGGFGAVIAFFSFGPGGMAGVRHADDLGCAATAFLRQHVAYLYY